MAKRKYCRDAAFEIRMTLPIMREATERLFTPESVAATCQDIAMLGQEVFQVLMLTSRNRLIDRITCTIGLLDSTVVHPREIYRAAIQYNAAAIVLVHNHPSGDPTPSAEDVRITHKLIEAGKIIDIKVMDHIVIGRKSEADPKGYVSFRESNLAQFT